MFGAGNGTVDNRLIDERGAGGGGGESAGDVFAGGQAARWTTG